MTSKNHAIFGHSCIVGLSGIRLGEGPTRWEVFSDCDDQTIADVVAGPRPQLSE